MWYTIPSDKNEQKQCIEFLNEYIQNFSMDEDIDFRDDLAELASFYSGEKPFDAESAYDKLYNIYTALDIDNGKTKNELFGQKNSLDAFKDVFLEAWKKISYIALTNGSDIYYSTERDKYLKVYDELHDNKKMEDNAIQEVARNMHRVLDDSNHDDMRDKITALETSIDNQNNADNIYLGVRDSQSLKNLYTKNRLQLLHQFANSDVSDIKAYIPFYGRMEDIKADKVASPEEVKKVATNMKDNSLSEIREKIKDLWENPEVDPNFNAISKISAENYGNLSRAMDYIDRRISREEYDKASFLDDLKESCAKAEKLFPNQIEFQFEEFKAILKKNQDLVNDINHKIEIDPEFGAYEDPVIFDMLKGLQTESQRQADKVKLSSLCEAAEERYTQALSQYIESLNKHQNVLQQKYNEVADDDRKYDQKLNELFKKDAKLIDQRKNLDLLSKDQLEKHLNDKKNLDQDIKNLRSKRFPVKTEQKNSVDELNESVQQRVDQTTDDFNAVKESISNTFIPDQLEKNYQEVTYNLKAYNEKYTAYFRDVEKRYAQVCADRQSLKEVFEAAGDITKKKGFFSIQKKNPKIFTDTMNAVEAYINDRKNPGKAEAAYDACRKYIASYMKSDKSGLKSGNKDGNTRRQTIVRMLELMDNLPEFQKLVAPERKNKDGWEVVDKKDTSKYTKLNYKQLEESLAKHATKPKKSGKGAQKPAPSAFYDIDKLVNKKKENKDIKDSKPKGL